MVDIGSDLMGCPVPQSDYEGNIFAITYFSGKSILFGYFYFTPFYSVLGDCFYDYGVPTHSIAATRRSYGQIC
jgi:hypothetical protein